MTLPDGWRIEVVLGDESLVDYIQHTGPAFCVRAYWEGSVFPDFPKYMKPVRLPNWFERLLGITALDKIEQARRELKRQIISEQQQKRQRQRIVNVANEAEEER